MRKLVIISVLLCTTTTFLFLAGLSFFLTDHEPDGNCEMTYMFEFPQYVKISQPIDTYYRKYSLYAYGEGRMTKKARNMDFTGIPVVFIPGNAGSYQQVRSLSSVALRKALNSRSSDHFDYYTIDFNSELSALYGPILFEQLQYVLKSIERVLELYKHQRNGPKQVVLIGHSVGGIVARKAIASLTKENKQLVSVLITLASPLLRSPVYFDRQSSAFYASSSVDQNDITVVSIAGGYSDLLVPSYLSVDGRNGSINVVSTNVARCWVESNHVQILWCKQLVLAINRALFNCIDRNTHQVSTNSSFVTNVFRHHLVHNSGTMHHIGSNKSLLVKIDYTGEWIEDIRKQYTADFKTGLKQPLWYMVGLTLQPGYKMLSILAINLEVTDWLFACNAAFPNKASRVCVEAQHLTRYSEIAPTSRFKRRLVTIDLHEIRKENNDYTHLVFRALPTREPVTFHVDTYGAHEREMRAVLPKMSLKRHTIISETPHRAVIFNIFFSELEDPLQVYQLYLEPIQCNAEHHHATISLITGWSNENLHVHTTESSNKPLLLRLQHAKPPGAADAKVRLVLDPSCSYQINIQLNIFGTFGQIIRHYSTFLLSTMVVVFLLAFQNQIKELGESNRIPIFFVASWDGLNTLWIVVLTAAGSLVFKDLMPEPEFKISFSYVYSYVAMLVLLIVSFSAVFLLAAAYSISLFALESTVHKFALKLLAKSATLTVRFSDYFMSFLHKVPFIVAAAQLVLCFSTCGAVALCVGLVFYFFKLTQMSQNYVEQMTWYLLKNLSRRVQVWCSKRLQNATTDNDDEEVETDQNDCLDNINSYKEASEGSVQSGASINCLELTETVLRGNSSSKMPLATETPAESSFNSLAQSHNNIFFHSSMFFIWVFVTVLNIPAALAWAHNFKYSKSLSPDESLIAGLVFSIGALFLWQIDLPRTNRKFTIPLRFIIIGLIPISFLYCSVSVYRLNYMLTFLFALVIIQQIAPNLEAGSDESPPERRASQVDQDKYEEAKTKMD
uniref:GPI inositol-deacylase n=1 Tax=Dendroctonus ponderosae TaxID=77166 RepID=A0AAR5PCQ5_DENPD